ncbi:MAG TPA: PilT/PilU family type 4a pilus ATPase [Acidimicrobiales bacterium]|nr:PilT/PilU family type 4a pilus ATPase [Acidimicrobiales bacterium]
MNQESTVRLLRAAGAAWSQRLGAAVVAAGLVSPTDMADLLAETPGRHLAEALVTRDPAARGRVLEAMGSAAGLPAVDLAADRPSAEALRAVSRDIGLEFGIIGHRVAEDGLVVAAAEPPTLEELRIVSDMLGTPVRVVVALPDLIEKVMQVVYSADLGAVSELSSNGASGSVATASAMEEPVSEEELDFHEGDIVLDDLLRQMVEMGGSDLHLSASSPPRVRVHGALIPLEGYGLLEGEQIQRAVFAVLTQATRERFEEHWELDTSHTVLGVGRFRLNVFNQRGNVGAVLRAIPFEIPLFETLGLPPAVQAFASLQRGLVLVTGPTGSGKSTTLASLIDIINRTRPLHIITVEDPIEFVHTNKYCLINQREVGEDTKGFADALKHVLRQDPDVILVGEMRDLETISTAITAAETGHLVFATLHTQDAPQTIDRIIDVFPPSQQAQIRTQLGSCLQGIVTQQLVPTADGGGRTVAVEVLVATPGIRNLVREGKTHQITSMMQAGGKHGMQTMDAHLAELVRNRTITEAVGLSRCQSEDEFRRHLKGA